MPRELVVPEKEWVTFGYHPSFTIDLSPLNSEAKALASIGLAGYILYYPNTGEIFVEILNPNSGIFINGERIKSNTYISVSPGSILSFKGDKKKILNFKLVLDKPPSSKIPSADNEDSLLTYKGDNEAVASRKICRRRDPYGTSSSENMLLNGKDTGQATWHSAMNTVLTDPEFNTVSHRRPARAIATRQAFKDNQSNQGSSFSPLTARFLKSLSNTASYVASSQTSDADQELKEAQVYQTSYLTDNPTNIVDLATQSTLPPSIKHPDPNKEPSLSSGSISSSSSRTEKDRKNDTLPSRFLITPFVISQGPQRTEEVPLLRLSAMSAKDPKRLERHSEVYYHVISSRSVKLVESESVPQWLSISSSVKAAKHLIDRILKVGIKDGKVEASTELVTPFTIDSVKAGILRDFESVALRLKHVLRSKPLVLRLSSPIFACGDLKGDLNALRRIYGSATFLNHWSATNVPVLFLGDYVAYSTTNLEVIGLLFSWSLLCPGVNLLRGSNEFLLGNDRVVHGVLFDNMPSEYTLLQQCRYCFGENSGRSLWSTIKDVLNTLPLAAVIDGKVFACHGGIPLLKKDKKCKFVPHSRTCSTKLAAVSHPFLYYSESRCGCQDSLIKEGPCRFVPSEGLFEEFLTSKCSRNYFEFEETDFREEDSPYTSECRQLVRELLGNGPSYYSVSSDKCKRNFEDSQETSFSEISTSSHNIDAIDDGVYSNFTADELDGSTRQFNGLALKHFLKRFKFSHLFRARGSGFIDDISYEGRMISLTSGGEAPYGCRIESGRITLYSLKEPSSCYENLINPWDGMSTL
ncbi:unnamed protein product [Phytomonas sp. EM1]|nr:unnamed protein product [Phytomonas sp. EM1]|eukprot:CCW62476.1 unnamed protein product [Phytomonas sp. isolate EM1]